MRWKAGLKKWQENRGKLKREIEAGHYGSLFPTDADVREVVEILKKQDKARADKQRDRIIRYTSYNTVRRG